MKRDVPSLKDHGSKILVVDDREDNRALLRYLFGPPEFQVLEATDGVEALALIERELPDCVLLDLEMPRLSGFDVLERIEADPRLRDIPVIIVTASDELPESMERALRAGAIDYITKPISLLHVRARVQGAIERGRLLRDIERLPAWLPPAAVPGLRAHLDEMTTYSELLQGREDAPEDVRRTYVSRIHQACRQVIARTGEFLHSAAHRTDERRFAAPPRAPAASVEQLARRGAPGAGQPDVTLDVREADGQQGPADPAAHLDQVLRNVLANALAFRATGGRV